MTKATIEKLKENVDRIFATLPESEAVALVFAALDMRDDKRSSRDLAIEFGVNETTILGIQHW